MCVFVSELTSKVTYMSSHSKTIQMVKFHYREEGAYDLG